MPFPGGGGYQPRVKGEKSGSSWKRQDGTELQKNRAPSPGAFKGGGSLEEKKLLCILDKKAW